MSYNFQFIARSIWLTAEHTVNAQKCLTAQHECWHKEEVMRCLLLVDGCVLLRSGSESSRQSWTRRFCCVRGLGFEAKFSVRNTSYLFLMMEGLIASEVWRQLSPSLGWHMRHWKQSNQKTNQTSEWWKELQRDWSHQSHRETESADHLPAILSTPLKSTAVNSPWGKKPLTKGKRKEELKLCFKKRPVVGLRLKMSLDQYVCIYPIYICPGKGWKKIGTRGTMRV